MFTGIRSLGNETLWYGANNSEAKGLPPSRLGECQQMVYQLGYDDGKSLLAKNCTVNKAPFICKIPSKRVDFF